MAAPLVERLRSWGDVDPGSTEFVLLVLGVALVLYLVVDGWASGLIGEDSMTGGGDDDGD